MTLEQAIEYAAVGLNYGWEISLSIENGSASLILMNPAGDNTYLAEMDHETPFSDQIVTATCLSNETEDEP